MTQVGNQPSSPVLERLVREHQSLTEEAMGIITRNSEYLIVWTNRMEGTGQLYKVENGQLTLQAAGKIGFKGDATSSQVVVADRIGQGLLRTSSIRARVCFDSKDIYYIYP